MSGESRYVTSTDFYNKSGLSYRDYLQARQFERSIRFGIREQTKAIVGSNESLANYQVRAIEDNTASIERGFSNLSLELESVKDQIKISGERIEAVLDWGFSETLASLDRINDTLKDLIRIAQNPSQIWAFEQFTIARDEFRRGLYEEAVESLTRAISGYGANPGNKTEFRFHYLLGVIHLGSIDSASSKVIDLDKAETDFYAAFRYAQSDFKAEAGVCLLGAGRAAYANGKLSEAREFLSKALQFNDSGEIHYQLAKVLAADGSILLALPHLRSAIKADVYYCLKAIGDRDFTQFQDEVDNLISELCNVAKQTLQDGICCIAEKRELLRDQNLKSKTGDSSKIFGAERFDTFALDMSNESNKRGLLDLVSAIKRFDDEFSKVATKAFGDLQESALKVIDSIIKSTSNNMPTKPRIGKVIPFVMAIVVPYIYFKIGQAADLRMHSGLYYLSVIGLLASPFIGFGLGLIIASMRNAVFEDAAKSVHRHINELEAERTSWIEMACPSRWTTAPNLMAQWQSHA